jgi:hypothetical protein
VWRIVAVVVSLLCCDVVVVINVHGWVWLMTVPSGLLRASTARYFVLCATKALKLWGLPL